MTGVYGWCGGCGHGGHLKCLDEWYADEVECAGGCGHICVRD